jgi:hypothetical protein
MVYYVARYLDLVVRAQMLESNCRPRGVMGRGFDCEVCRQLQSMNL